MMFGGNKIKRLEDHAEIKVYQKEMRRQNRCHQCVHPWCKGVCSCKKTGPDQDEMAKLGFRLQKEGWR